MSEHPYRMFHAFSGGLDSLYAVYTSIKKHPNYLHHLTYIDFYQQHDRTEMLVARTQARILSELFPEVQIGFNVVKPSRPAYYQMCLGNGCGRQPLMQQGITIVTMTNEMAIREQHFGRFVACTVGWNKGDTFEECGSILEWSLADYDRLREMYDSLIYFQDLGRQPRLMTPSWDKTKLEMWRALPGSLRRLAYAGTPNYTTKTVEIESDKVVYEIKLKGQKLKEYAALGVKVTEVFKFVCRPVPPKDMENFDLENELKNIKETLLYHNVTTPYGFQIPLDEIEYIQYNPEPVPERN